MLHICNIKNTGMILKKYSDRLDTEEREELSDSDFGIPVLRKFPIPDAAHVRAAEAYFRYAPDNYKSELAHNIMVKALLYGMEIKSPTIVEWAAKWK